MPEPAGAEAIAISQEQPIADEAPWSDGFNAYDEAQFPLYLRLLDAVAARAAEAEICAVLLGMDVDREPERARRCLQSHLKRARWLARGEGFRFLIGREGPAGGYRSESRH